MAEGDRARWDAKYLAGTHQGEPSVLVTALDGVLPTTGRALDVGGGAGRHAVWLARRGLDVTVADVSPEALGLAVDRARREGVALATLETDIEIRGLPAGPWDVVLVFHFLDRASLAKVRDVMAPGGWLVLVHPTRSNLERHERPSARFLLEDGEAARLVSGLQIVSHDEGWLAEGRHEARLVARRA